VKCQWVYNTKFTFDGVVERHKARLVSNVFSQQEDIKYTKTFSLFSNMNYFPLIISLATCFGWKIHQMDMKSVFLHGDLFEEIFMEQTTSFVSYSNLVCRLKNQLYGLKQAPPAWYVEIDSFFLRLGFKHCGYDHILYVLYTNGDTLIVVVYVDDLVIIGNNNDLILRLNKYLDDSFDMTNLGTLHYFFGPQVLPLCDGFSIYQSKYVMDFFTCFNMVYFNPCATPFQSRVKLTKTCQTPLVDATLY
jgi:hypothetical protein